MKDFKRNTFRPQGGPGGRPKFGNKKFGESDGGRREHRSNITLYPAVCADCHKDTMVPFRPVGGKPVYCRDCFNKQPHVPGRNSNGQDGARRDNSPSAQNPAIDSLKKQIDALDSKVNRILEIMNELMAEAAEENEAEEELMPEPEESAPKSKRKKK